MILASDLKRLFASLTLDPNYLKDFNFPFENSNNSSKANIKSIENFYEFRGNYFLIQEEEHVKHANSSTMKKKS